MMAQPKEQIILVDTNVWLDAFFPYRPHTQEACAFLNKAIGLGYNLVYPVHALKDLSYIACREMKLRLGSDNKTTSAQDVQAIRSIAWSCVEYVRDMATAVGADESDAWLACKYRSLNDDLEDNFVLAAAKRAHAAFLVTSDETLLRKATVEAHTPADALALLSMMDD